VYNIDVEIIARVSCDAHQYGTMLVAEPLFLLCNVVMVAFLSNY